MGRLTFLLVAVALLATACGERSEPTEPNVSPYPVTVQTGGDRPLVIERAAERVVAVSARAAELVRALRVEVRLAPLDETGSVRLAALRRLRPDLIVAAGSSDTLDLSRIAAATGAQVYDAAANSIPELERSLTQLGLLTGRSVEARAVIRRIEQRRAEVRARVARLPAVDVFVDTGFFTTVSDQSLFGSLIGEARGRNVAGTHPDTGPIDLDELARENPDVYIATNDAMISLEELRENPQTRELSAVRDGRFAIVDVALLEPGPRVGDTLLELARILHPDAFR